MSIKDKLNSAWQTDKMTDAIFEFRAVAQDAYNALQETLNRLDDLTGSASFANVDNEIKAEGVAIRNILNNAKDALDSHAEFINWKSG